MILKTAILDYLDAISPQVLEKNQAFLAKAIKTINRLTIKDNKANSVVIAAFTYLFLFKVRELTIDDNLKQLYETCTHLKPAHKPSYKSKR